MRSRVMACALLLLPTSLPSAPTGPLTVKLRPSEGTSVAQGRAFSFVIRAHNASPDPMPITLSVELQSPSPADATVVVVEWATTVPSAQMFLSVITVHELEYGVLLIERADPTQGELLRRWLDGSVAVAFAERVLPVDEAVARRAAALHVPDPAPFRDALIGATAIVHRMVVVTRNTADFERFEGLTVVNPWL